MNIFVTFSALLGLAWAGSPWHNSNCRDGRKAMVHLFEWKWSDIATECESFLSPMGYCGVQLSPAMEHLLVGEHPWWQRYQPVSYKLTSRSGTEAELRDMVTRCNNVGVNIYIDAVINHMAGMDREGYGSANSYFSTMNNAMDFPSVPFATKDFNGCDSCPACCCINAWQDHAQVRNCRLVGLSDLKLSDSYVRQKVSDYMNTLIDMGVAGFRVDAAKHMWPADLQAVWESLHDLNTQWFASGSKAAMFLEVIDMNQQGEVKAQEYTHLGRVTDFRFCTKVKEATGGLWGVFGLYDPGWGMVPSEDAFVFVDNHDNQRGHGGGGDLITHKKPSEYRIAQAITLSQTYGFPRVMSSFYFENGDQGPPNHGAPDYRTKDVIRNADMWQAIAGMASFAKATSSTNSMDNRWNEGNQVAFSRGDKGFIAITNQGYLNRRFYTGLPEGSYCDVITGCPISSGCAGKTVNVDFSGNADIMIDNSEVPILAIHVEARAGSNGCIGAGQQGTVPTVQPTAPPATNKPPETPSPATTYPPQTTRGVSTILPTPPPTNPPPSGYSRTVIFLRLQTNVGQDVFIRGGINHERRFGCTNDAETSACAISVSHEPQGTSSHYDKYNSWRAGDSKLDWYGAQASQGDHYGERAEGTPMAWTSSNSGSSGYQPDNKWGDHYWRVELNMNCAETEDGWFELKGFVTNGPGWENDIWQDSSCTGNAGGQKPYISSNHMARCGYRNVFSWNENSCLIDSM